MDKAIFIGDSNTWAQHFPEEDRWPYLVSEVLQLDYINAAQPGAASRDYIPWVPSNHWDLFVRPELPADLLYIQLGTVDSFTPDYTPINEYIGNFLAMTWEFRNSNPNGRVKVLCPPRNLNPPTLVAYYGEWLKRMASLLPPSTFEVVADLRQVLTYPSDFVDGIHISVEGQQKIADAVIALPSASGATPNV